ncbi:hypothetical protein ISF_03195 [Cordyceps fumosorosea ARSEF 2679]|uniref:Pre-rRNA processing protein n=1 Tax=Cordyceps fumosorosea (strain ARSEF 2679) TaxID=1081104 RepID=A0A168AJ61_CORFA|nr:hypothetical protein ISF_03195 [Cordyceps fumosorosea ARSEF 2679]OAA68820.1 hypothetical protein ISF_03195 [Cordyceps fumosorosea ARSEF 2679]
MAKAGPSKEKNPFKSGSESEQSDSQSEHSQTPSDNESPAAATTSKKESKEETKGDDGKKNKGHFKKYWKYYVVGVVLGLAILLPLFFKVFIPLIIARFINSRNILVQHASVYIRSSSEIDFAANASVASPMAARVGDLEFTLHDMAVEQPPTVLTADIKGFDIQKATKIDIPQGTLHVNDSDALIAWADRFIDSDSIPFDVRVSGLDVFLGLLRYTFNLARPITINGLRGLADITLNDVALVLPPVDDKNVRANISFSNPSSLSVKVGNVTVDLAVNDLHIGQALAYDVSLVPGTTNVHIDGLVDIPLILNNLGAIIRGQAAQLQAGYVSLKLQVTGFNMHGEQIDFLGALLRKRVLVAKVPLVALINGAGTSIIKSGLVGMGMANGTTMGGTTLLDAIGDVFSNKTLLDRIQGHWARKRARDQYRYTRT